MGAIPYDGGTTFRVWAPHATPVFVTGTFDDWAGDAARRSTRDDDGDGRHLVRRCRGRRARRRVPLHDPDPRRRPVAASIRTPARSPTRSATRIVYDPAAFDWGDDDFRMPGWDDLVIYEMHVGTFAATADRAGTSTTPAGGSATSRPRDQRRPGHAAVRVRRRHLVGLQPGPPVRDRVGLRRAGRVQALHPRCPRARASRSSSTSSTTTSARPTSTCGGSTAGPRAMAAGSTSTTTIARRHAVGRRPARTTAAARSGRSCATAP